MRGRVGSLLEVGTGFHPELTGRENVLLNGAILGMKRAEILAKFDAIVAFAEVEPFIDTPVKHYSSGMYLRLAFAVAAHLEPEILLVDEVLAVGDAAFQKRCLGKMNDVAREGRTVIFVSHNLQAIQRLCSHAVMLEAGQVAAFGDTSTVVGQYLSRDYLRPAPGARIDVSTLPRTGTGEARFVSVSYTNGSGVERGNAVPGRPTGVRCWRSSPTLRATCAACRCSCSSSTARRCSTPTRCTSIAHLPSAGPQLAEAADSRRFTCCPEPTG